MCQFCHSICIYALLRIRIFFFSLHRFSRVTPNDLGWDWEHPVSSGWIRHTYHRAESWPVIQGIWPGCWCFHHVCFFSLFTEAVITFFAYQRFQNQEEERGLAWKWQTKPPPKIVPRSRRRCGRLQRILQGKQVLYSHFWGEPRRFVVFCDVLTLLKINYLQLSLGNEACRIISKGVRNESWRPTTIYFLTALKIVLAG